MLAKLLKFFETLMKMTTKYKSWLIIRKYTLHFVFLKYLPRSNVNCYDYRDSSGALIIFQGLKLQFENIKSGINETSEF